MSVLFQAGLASPSFPEQLLIALEPEAASIYCRRLRMHQLVPEQPIVRPLQSPRSASTDVVNQDPAVTDLTVGELHLSLWSRFCAKSEEFRRVQ